MKQHYRCLSLGFLLLLGACQPTTSDFVPVSTQLEGKVTDTKKNTPIADATIYLRGFNTVKGVPTSFNPHRAEDWIKKVKTDVNGTYTLRFNAQPDSSYQLIALHNEFYAPNESNIKPVKSNETQTIHFNLCSGPLTRILYFNDRGLTTDSVNFVVTRYRPCETTISTWDDSAFFNNILASTIAEPNAQGITGLMTNLWTEDDTEVTVKWTRFVNRNAVQTVERKLKPRIGNVYPQDTIHIVF